MQFPNSHSRKKTQAQSSSEGASPPFSFSPTDSRDRPSPSAPRLDALPNDLPDRYPESVLWSIARDPSCLFTYWQLSVPIRRLPGLNLALVVTRDNQTEALYHLEKDTGSRFIPVSQPGALYLLTLCFLAPGTTTRALPKHIIHHRQVRTPRNTPVPVIPDPLPSIPPPLVSPPASPRNRNRNHNRTPPPTPFTFTPDPHAAPPPTPTPTLNLNPPPLPPFPSLSPPSVSPPIHLFPPPSPTPRPAPPPFTPQPSLPVPLPDSLASSIPTTTLPGYPSSSSFPITPVRELHGFHPESA